MRYLVLIDSVVVHRPDFLASSATPDEEDLAFRDSLNSTAEAEDNFISKLVRRLASCVSGGGILVLLPEHLGRRDVLHVIKPPLHCHVVTGKTHIPERKHGRVRRWNCPVIELDIGRRAGSAGRKETLRNHVEDSGVI